MDFKSGDLVSRKDFQYGEVCGIEAISDCDFLKIKDLTKKATYFIPLDDAKSLRRLPSKVEALKRLKIFQLKELIDIGEIEGSRYKFFKAKLEIVNFEKSLEVLHDMAALKLDGLLNSSEKKLYSGLKEKIGLELSYVLGKSLDEVNSILDFSPLEVRGT